MEELIKSSKAMLDSFKTEYNRLQEVFKGETDVNKMDALDSQISQIGKDIVALESKVISLEIAAKKSSFNSIRDNQLAKSICEHSQETYRVIKEYYDSLEQAKYLTSRVATGVKIVGDVLKTIV